MRNVPGLVLVSSYRHTLAASRFLCFVWNLFLCIIVGIIATIRNKWFGHFLHIQIPLTGHVGLILCSMLWLLQVAVPLTALWRYSYATVTGATAHGTLNSTLSSSSHCGTVLYVTYVAGQEESRCVHGSCENKSSQASRPCCLCLKPVVIRFVRHSNITSWAARYGWRKRGKFCCCTPILCQSHLTLCHTYFHLQVVQSTNVY